jgi:hypothetical protein
LPQTPAGTQHLSHKGKALMGTFDLGKVVGIMLAIVLIGVLLKDSAQFDNIMKGLNSTLSTLEAAG